MAQKSSTAGKVAAGLGAAALAAAAAATYYFSGSEGKKHKKQVSDLGKKAKTEMLTKIKQMKSVSKEAYHKASAEVLSKYKQLKNVDPAELAALGKELKGHWDSIAKTLEKAQKKVAAAKKPAKKKAKK